MTLYFTYATARQIILNASQEKLQINQQFKNESMKTNVSAIGRH